MCVWTDIHQSAAVGPWEHVSSKPFTPKNSRDGFKVAVCGAVVLGVRGSGGVPQQVLGHRMK